MDIFLTSQVRAAALLPPPLANQNLPRQENAFLPYNRLELGRGKKTGFVNKDSHLRIFSLTLSQHNIPILITFRTS